ncbi:MAG: TolB family protein, partial [Acidimicrobiia bacterium]
MRPSLDRWTARSMVVAALMAATVATPAGAAVPDGALSKVSPGGASSEAVIDDTGTVIAYLQGPTGHVMINDRADPLVRDAGAREIEISGDGNIIVFSTDKALAGGDANAMRDVYAVNRDGGGLRLISTAAAGVGAFSPSVNGNGGVVAWSGDAGGVRKIFVRDGGNAPVEAALPGGITCDCVAPSINHDGSTVAFEVTDFGVFVWRRGGTAQHIDKKGSSRPSLSGTGRMVAYQFQNNINVFNLDTGESTLVPADGLNPALSASGNAVAFQASGILANDTNGEDDVAVWDLPGRRLVTVSSRPDGMTGSGGSFQPSINSDGGRVAFESLAGDLIPGDGNGLADVFLRIPGTGAVAPVCCDPGGGPVPDIPDIPGSYWLVASDGGIFSFAGPEPVRTPKFFGSTGNVRLNQPIVGMASHPSGQGYWFVASDGGIFSFGAAKFYGSTGNVRLNRPIVGMASTPSGNGYWMVADDGGIFSFGDAKFYGSTGNVKLNKPIVGMASSPSGNGYWMVATDGGIFSFGDAGFYGSTGAVKLNKPIVGMSTRPQGDGYWLVASDGGIFTFGAAPFHGSTGAVKLNQPIVGMAPTSTGNGYWFVAS